MKKVIFFEFFEIWMIIFLDFWWRYDDFNITLYSISLVFWGIFLLSSFCLDILFLKGKNIFPKKLSLIFILTLLLLLTLFIVLYLSSGISRIVYFPLFFIYIWVCFLFVLAHIFIATKLILETIRSKEK